MNYTKLQLIKSITGSREDNLIDNLAKEHILEKEELIVYAEFDNNKVKITTETFDECIEHFISSQES